MLTNLVDHTSLKKPSMSGNHHDAVPVSHLNSYENSLQHPEQTVLKIAPRESNFITLEADQATDSVVSFTVITPSSKTLLSQSLYFSWTATVILSEERGFEDQQPPEFPKMFTPVADPLAKITENCQVSINGRSDNVESSIISKMTEQVGNHTRLIRSFEPRQIVKGSCVGAIPGKRGLKDYYFDGVHDDNDQMDEVQPDIWRETYEGSSNYFRAKDSGVVDVPGGGTKQRWRTYEFMSPVPFDLFVDRDDEALVNVNELTIYMKFHTNIMGRLFAWRGQFAGRHIIQPTVTLGDTDRGGHKMKLLYKTITSASEASIPNKMTTLYTNYRIIREQYTNQLAPVDNRPERVVNSKAENRVGPTSTQITMKATRLTQIPNRIFLFAAPPSRWLDSATPGDSIGDPNNAYFDGAGNAIGFLPANAMAQDTHTQFFRQHTPLPANPNIDDEHWYISNDVCKGLLNGDYVMWLRGDENGTYAPIDLSDGTWHNMMKWMNYDKINVQVNGAYVIQTNDRAHRFTGISTRYGLTPFFVYGDTYRLFFHNRMFISKGPDPNLPNIGYGNEIPQLKITDVRLTLNNKHNLLMVPQDQSDKFYYAMNAKNGAKASFQDFKQGGPIVIDCGEDLGSMGLVTGAMGNFDCGIQFTVHNTARDNGYPSYNSVKYGNNPFIPLRDGFIAYAMFEYVTALQIQPEVASMSTGVEFATVKQSVENVVDSTPHHVSARGGSMWGLSKKGNVAKVGKLGRSVFNSGVGAYKKGRRIARQAQDAIDKGERFADRLEQAANHVAGGGVDMYG